MLKKAEQWQIPTKIAMSKSAFNVMLIVYDSVRGYKIISSSQ